MSRNLLCPTCHRTITVSTDEPIPCETCGAIIPNSPPPLPVAKILPESSTRPVAFPVAKLASAPKAVAGMAPLVALIERSRARLQPIAIISTAPDELPVVQPQVEAPSPRAIPTAKLIAPPPPVVEPEPEPIVAEVVEKPAEPVVMDGEFFDDEDGERPVRKATSPRTKRRPVKWVDDDDNRKPRRQSKESPVLIYFGAIVAFLIVSGVAYFVITSIGFSGTVEPPKKAEAPAAADPKLQFNLPNVDGDGRR
jgi:hypothetical protein